ncbi:VapE domain-containing protein [Pseudomonas aeruginosa]
MEQLKHDTAAAIDFLRNLSPENGWSLTAIIPDGETETRTFKPGEADAAAAWIEGHQGKRGLYYHINLVRARLNKKASKEQIAGFRAFHIDVDPRAGEELASEQERIYKLLTTPRDGVPPPSLIVSSGGGYQAVWLLGEPLMIPAWKGEGNEPPELLLGEAINRGLQNAYSKDEARADNTQDCTRLLRLPGTINVPNKKKAAKGRGPALSSLVPGADFSRRYAVEDFDKLKVYADQPKEAAPLATAGQVPPRSKQAPADKWKIADAAIPPTVGTAELTAWADANGKAIDDWALALVTTGDASKYDGDRSDMVFAVTCHLARVGAPKELIAGLLLDPNNTAFYEHVSAQKGNKRRYVERQVNRAYAEVAKGDGTAGTLPGGEVLTWDRMNQNGEPLPSYWNTRTALLLMGVECRYDKFRDRHLIGSHELDEYAGDFSDHAERILRDAIIRRFGFDPGEVNPRNAVLSLCTENRFDSLLDHLHALPPWDGTPRLDTWLVDYLGAEDNAYTREAGAAWLSAAIVRAFEPGAKFDQMLVLEGATGLGKSTALRVLATGTLDLTCADRFSDASFLGARDAREVLEVTAGVWILECAELDGMSRKEVETLKAAITRQEDKGRLAYARTAVTVPRRFVLAGTTNEDRYLHDPTGNRRFWPVRVARGNLEGLAAVRDQLVAEALARYRSDSHRLLLSPEAEALAKQEQDRRRVVDEGFMESLHDLSACLQRGTGQWAGRWIVTNDAVYGHLGLTRDKRVGKVPRMVKTAMQALGWKKVPQTVKVDGKPSNIFVWEGEGEPGKPEGEEATTGGDRPPF